MAVPTSGAVSLADIRREFGASAGTPLHAFVRGGSYVPDISENSGVPTSPPISIDDLRGARAAATLTANNGSATIYGSYGPAAQPPFNVSGTAYATFGGGVAPFTVTWSKVSGSGTVGGTGNPGHFSASAIGATATGVFGFTVKDSAGTSKSAQMTITFQAKR